MSELKKRRHKYKYSCEFMANILGISKTYYWQLENGSRRITYDMAIKIAKFFDMTPDQLFNEDTKYKIENEKQN